MATGKMEISGYVVTYTKVKTEALSFKSISKSSSYFNPQNMVFANS
jgi:hypothetical protein